MTQRRGKHVAKNCRQLAVDPLMSYDSVDDQPCGDTTSVGQIIHPVGGDELLLPTSSVTVDNESAGETVLHKASRYNYQVPTAHAIDFS